MELVTGTAHRRAHVVTGEFRNLVMRISRVLGNATESTIADIVPIVLEELATWLRADVAFTTVVDADGLITDTWTWTHPDRPQVGPAVGSPMARTIGSALEFLKLGHTITVDDIDTIDLGPDERRMARANGLRSLVMVPVRSGGTFVGIVGVRMLDRPRAWEPDDVAHIEVVAPTLVQAIVRTRQRSALEKAAARARRLARLVPSPVTMVDRAGRITWLSPSFTTATGRPADGLLGTPVASLFADGEVPLLTAAPPATPEARTLRLLHADGSWRWTELSWQADDRDGAGFEDEVVVELRDVHERTTLLDELRRDADTDPLTGVLNRKGLGRALADLAAAGATVATAFCDLNGFKAWNDRHGHGAGDEMLRSVAAGLASAVRAGDLVARVGGDEFVVVVVDPSPTELDALADRLGVAVAGAAGPGAHTVTAAVGVAGPGPATDADRQRRDADVAMYRAKRAGDAA